MQSRCHVLAAKLAAERQQHVDECLLLADDNRQLQIQLGAANRQIEMRATEYSRTSFELRRENARVEVNSASSRGLYVELTILFIHVGALVGDS
jgi:hypothetical protein